MSKDYQNPKQTILAHGLKPKKSFGQNFMQDERVNALFVSALRSLSNSGPNTILEIGAGTGALTEHLLKAAKVVHAIERDRDLVPILHQHFTAELSQKKLFIHEADGARFAIDSILSKEAPGLLVGNLPYHLTSSILLLALKYRDYLQGAIFLVQKEVAERLLASPHNKNYGFLTVILNLAFDISKVALVDKSAFWPVPKVDSAIISLKTNDHGISKVSDVQDLLLFVRGIFQKRRKKLSTILGSSFLASDFLALDIDPNLRPENLRAEQFLQLFLNTPSPHLP